MPTALFESGLPIGVIKGQERVRGARFAAPADFIGTV
jgi:hypothetical protein